MEIDYWFRRNYQAGASSHRAVVADSLANYLIPGLEKSSLEQIVDFLKESNDEFEQKFEEQMKGILSKHDYDSFLADHNSTLNHMQALVIDYLNGNTAPDGHLERLNDFDALLRTKLNSAVAAEYSAADTLIWAVNNHLWSLEHQQSRLRKVLDDMRSNGAVIEASVISSPDGAKLDLPEDKLKEYQGAKVYIFIP